MKVLVTLIASGLFCSAAQAQQKFEFSESGQCNFFPSKETSLPIAGWVRETRNSISQSCKSKASPFLNDEAMVKFRMTVTSSGGIADLAVKESSGDSKADKFYAERIREAGPFPPAAKTLSPKAETMLKRQSKPFKGPFLVCIGKSTVQVQPDR